MRFRTTRLLALLLLPFLLLAACSDDDGGDGGEASGSGSEASASASGSEMAAGEGDGETTPATDKPDGPTTTTNLDRSGFCQQWPRALAANDAEYDDNDPNAVKGHYAGVVAALTELERVAPIDIKGAVTVVKSQAQNVANTGDESADDTDETRVNGQRLRDYAAEHCA